MNPCLKLISRTIISLAILCTSPLGLSAPTANGSSFLDAKKSYVDYTKTKIKRSRISCQSLTSLSDVNNSILSSTLISVQPGQAEMCVVRGVIKPEVQYIIYLPTNWNGRIYMHGNGGYAGESLDDEIGHFARLKAVRNGFVAAFTNTGHDAESESGASWGYNNIQKEIDFGFRAVHVTIAAVKELSAAYYGKEPRYSYFDGCSTGGLQGFSEAQRFPDDFDGILVGAPVFNLSHMIWQYWQNHMALNKTPLSREKLEMLGNFILESFDQVDGVKDGVIANPPAIDFVAQRDLPRAKDGHKGFTDDEISMLSVIYGPTYVGETKIYPRTVIGGEFPGLVYPNATYETTALQSPWEGRVVPDSQGQLEQHFILQSWFQNLAFEVDDKTLDWRTLDPQRDLPRMKQSSRIFDASNPDLRSFYRKGGKMIIYHGWTDFGISPLATIEYFEKVIAILGDKVAEFLKLYMVPGMGHCRGGVNVDRFDLMTPLIDWVESGIVPKDIVGRRVIEGKTTRTRPLCAYPQIARYRGMGSIEEHSNFECINPQ